MKTIKFIIAGLLVFHLCGYAGEKRALTVAISKYREYNRMQRILFIFVIFLIFSQLIYSQNAWYSLRLQSRRLIEEGKYQACVDLLKDREEVNNIVFLSLSLGFSYLEIGNYQKADSLISNAANISEAIGDNSLINEWVYKHYLLAEKIRKTIGAFDKSNYLEFLRECDLLRTRWMNSDISGEIRENESIPFEHLLSHDEVKEILTYLSGSFSFLYNLDIDKKERLLLLCKNKINQYFGKNTDEYVRSTRNLANFYKEINSINESNYYLEEIEEILQCGCIKNAATYFQTLGNYYLEKEDYIKAELYFLEYYNRTGSSGNNDLISLYVRTGQWERAFQYQLKQDEWAKNEYFDNRQPINNYFIIINDNPNIVRDSSPSRFNYGWSEESILRIVGLYPTQEAINHAFNVMLFTKGWDLKNTRETRNLFIQSNNRELIKSRRLLSEVTKDRDSIKGRNDLPKVEKYAALVKADSIINRLNEMVQLLLKDEIRTENTLTWELVKSSLADREVAIEFVYFHQIDYLQRDTIGHYAALLLRNDIEAPVYIPLFNQLQLDSLFYNEKTDERIKENFYLNEGQNLYHLLWQPLEQHLQGIEKIYYAPSGMLNKISFAAIPVDTIFLIDKYNLQLVSSTRELVREKQVIESFLPLRNAVEYGGIRYSLDEQVLTEAVMQAKPTQVNIFDSCCVSDQTNRSLLRPLQGTIDEINQIEKFLNESKISNKKYMGEDATEESFKLLSGDSPELIHIATHGFFLDDEGSIKSNRFVQGIIDNQNSKNLLAQRIPTFQNFPLNPMLRSYLLFAGSNRAWYEGDILPDMEDGVLTADEIAQLDLSKTKLVVLSACETGLGEVKSSEGVFGLQRAFKFAGVKTIVMSLWKVPDEATKELMINFYKNLLSGFPMQESLQKAQKTVRDKYANPYYWAGFVIMDCLDNYSIRNVTDEKVLENKTESEDFEVGIARHKTVQTEDDNKELEWIEQEVENYNAIENALSSPNMLIFYNRGTLYSKMGRYDEAIEEFDKAIEGREDAGAELYLQRADAKRLKGAYQKAISDFTKSIELDSMNSWAFYRRGWTKEFNNDFQGALEDYTTAIAMNDKYAYSYFSRADLYISKFNQPELAENDYLSVLKLDNAIMKGGNCRQYALYYLGRIEEAIAYQNAILDKYPTAGNYYDAACFYARMNRFPDAIDYLRIAIEKGFRHFIHIENDVSFTNIRNAPEFIELIK